MAIIIPFADPNAHGSICDTVSFRRHRGKVVFQKKPKPKQPNTPAQQAQKQWWKDSWKQWRQLNATQLDYLATKAGPLNTTPANYYFDLKDTEDACSKIAIMDMDSMPTCTIDNPVAPGKDLEFIIANDLNPPVGGYAVHGRIWDNENIWVPTTPPTVAGAFLFYIVNQALAPRSIPEDYSLTFTYTRTGGGGQTVTVKFPATDMPDAGPYIFYADTTWALYDSWPLVTPVKVNPDYWPPL